MEIKVKFKLRQIVYFMHNNSVSDGIVNTIFVTVDGNGIKITYVVGTLHNMAEEVLFGTKEALLNSL